MATRTNRFEALDHCRGLACLLVIVYHSTMIYRTSVSTAVSSSALDSLLRFTRHLQVGVALFFVISGYCIAAAADNARRRNMSVGRYFIRRFRRIYPPFWAVVAFSVALFFVLDYGWTSPLLSSEPWRQYRPSWYSPSQWLGNITLTETWRHYVFGGIRGHFPGQAWTLCYEEQFYFLTGLLLLVSPKRLFSGVLVVSAATLVTMYLHLVAGLAIDGWFFDGSWLLFAAGVAVYYRLQYADGPMVHVLDAMLLGAAGLSLAARIPIYGAGVGFLFAAALPWLHRADGWVASATWLRPLQLTGQMCYSLYLVHQIPVKAVTAALFRAGLTMEWSTAFIVMPAAVATSVALGWAFHITVERRFLNSPIPRSDSALRQGQLVRADAPLNSILPA